MGGFCLGQGTERKEEGKMNTYEGCAHGLDWAQGFRVPRRCHDVPHETVAFNAEAKGGPVGQSHDAHGRCDIRQRKREEMGDPQRRRHGQKVPELVSGAFLHLHETVISAFIKTKQGRREVSTFSLVAVLGSITLRTSRVSWVREGPIWPCFMTKDLGESSEEDAADCTPFR
jgi:hypothetical protein